MLEAFWSATSQIASAHYLLFLVLGVFVGLFLGAVPGLSGLTGLALLLPLTFGMRPVDAFALLMGMYAVTSTGDSIPAVLINVPGTAGAAATIMDGYPMAKKGEAGRALAAAFTASALGGLFGALVLALLIPLARPVILSFGAPEFMTFALFSITLVGALTEGSMLKGLIAGGLGLLVATVGLSPRGAVPRYTFGQLYLLDELPLVPVALGLFGLPEVIELAAKGGSIARVPVQLGKGVSEGIKDSFRHWWLLLRSSAIGAFVGVLPAIGAATANWIAYGHAVQTCRPRDGFGKGDVRGVIAPEAANNASKGGDLVPTVTLGIPGDAGMAILLGGFLIVGLTPGPAMLREHLDVTFSLVWTVALANLLSTGLCLAFTRQIAQVAFIRGSLLIPFLLLFIFMGSFAAKNQFADLVSALVFGALGYAMKQLGWSRPALLLGFVLGGVVEENYHLSAQRYGAAWLTRPFVVIFLAITLVSVLYFARHSTRGARKGSTEAED